MDKLHFQYENEVLTTGLKLFEPNDISYGRYLTWFNNPKITALTSHGRVPYTENDYNNYINSQGEKNIVFSIFKLLDLEMKGTRDTDLKRHFDQFDYLHIGNVSLQSVDYINGNAELAIIIGESAFFGKGIGTWACNMMLLHAFTKLRLNRVWSGTSEKNIGMQNIFNKLGFRKEGEWIKAKFLQGKYSNIIQYAILAEEWFSLCTGK